MVILEIDKEVILNNDKTNLYDITDYAIAKSVMEDFPKVLKIYEKLLPALEHYNHYLAVASVIIAVEDAQTLLKMQMDQFKSIHANKGKVKDGQ